MSTTTHPTRRQFLQGAGGIVITFALGGIARGGSRAEPRAQPVATPVVNESAFTEF